MDIKSIRIESNNMGYGPRPDSNDEVEQHLTISSTGKVWCSRYAYGEGFPYSLKSQEYFFIGKEAAGRILNLISKYLQSYQKDFVTDVGEWEMEVRFVDGNKKGFDGPLIGRVSVGDVDLSDYIRSEVPIDDLFVFDGGAHNEKE